MANKNSAVEMLLDKINELTSRLEILEARVNPTYSSYTSSIPINAIRSGHWNIWATPPTMAHDPYWISIADEWEDRMDEIQRQLDEINNTRIEVRDNTLYITWANNDWGNN